MLGHKHGWGRIIMVVLPMFYWSLVAVGLTIFTRRKIMKTYDRPMKEMAKAAKQVAQGDFSVYLPTIHPTGRYDYLDCMILDFNKMVAELGSMETMRTDFIANVSHEIKTPLSLIQNYTQLLQNEELTKEKEDQYLLTIQDSTKRLSTLITNILKLNKLESQQIVPAVYEYDLCRQLCECALSFEMVWEEKQIDFEADLEERAVVCADENLMELVWNNLLSNAFKFTDQGGIVSLKQFSDEKWVTVVVSDTGCGISEQAKKHIFDKFYQGDTSHATEGNGLGLALAYRVLQLMKGEITVDSKEGEGTAFTVKIPRKDL